MLLPTDPVRYVPVPANRDRHAGYVADLLWTWYRRGEGLMMEASVPPLRDLEL
jgi:hypothetical protein